MAAPTRKAIELKLRELISAATGGAVKARDLDPEHTLSGHLGLTSLAIVSLLFQFEQTFQIDLGALDIDPTMFRTVGSVVDKGCELVMGHAQS